MWHSIAKLNSSLNTNKVCRHLDLDRSPNSLLVLFGTMVVHSPLHVSLSFQLLLLSPKVSYSCHLVSVLRNCGWLKSSMIRRDRLAIRSQVLFVLDDTSNLFTH